MSIIVVVKQVPDLVEELEIRDDGTDLDREALTFVLNEFDDHALEQALLLKEATGKKVTVIGVDTTGELDQALYTAVAKGADRAIKLVGEFTGERVSNRAMAQILADAIRGLDPELVVSGVQGADDLDGQLPPMLAARLGLPHVGVVVGVQLSDGIASVRKEYWGGMAAELTVQLPAVLGIQAAQKPPRYVPVSRVRQAMKEAKIEEIEVDELPTVPAVTVRRLFKPVVAGRAEILTGDATAAARQVAAMLRERGIL